jgi:CRP-like cAMP-binding protein
LTTQTAPRWASGTADLDPVRDELRRALRGVLAGCAPQTIEGLVGSASVRSFAPDEAIYAQGDNVPLTFILRGYGIARRTTADGHQLFSGVASAGNLFGYSGIAGAQSSIEMVAISNCEVARWPGGEVRAIAAEDPAFALVAIDSMASSLHVLMGQIEGFLHQNARRRVLRILARYRALFFEDPVVLNRTHLPGLVGTTREMTGRVLRQLEREGLLRREGRAGLRLLQPDRLDTGTA